MCARTNLLRYHARLTAPADTSENRDNIWGSSAGALLSYGPSFVHEFYRAGSYIDKILKGENPADIPVEQPDKFELAVNPNKTKTIGAKISQLLLIRADTIIG